jgi:DNA-binding beta-propeller fold protein YncE
LGLGIKKIEKAIEEVVYCFAMRWIGLLLAGVALGASAQGLQTKTYGTSGHAAEAMVTPDGQYVLVTVDLDGGAPGSGIDVFHWMGDKLKRVAFQPLGNANAQGILLIPHTRVLAVGMSNLGVAFLPLDAALQGKASVKVLPQGEGAGSGYLAATADGKELFVANEYGNGGNVGVILLHPNGNGSIDPEATVHVPSGRATPG